MNNITVFVAGDANFKQYVKSANQSAKDLGYSSIVYDLGGLGFGIKYPAPVSDKPFQKNPMKPKYMLHALANIEENDFLVWLDADAVMTQRIDEVIGEYDIGITIRNNKERNERASTINSGVMFVRNTPHAHHFLNHWQEKTEQFNGDQWALNVMCKFEVSDTWKTKQVIGARVKGFPCKIYNNFYFNTNQQEAKIIHYKTEFRKRHPTFIQNVGR